MFVKSDIYFTLILYVKLCCISFELTNLIWIFQQNLHKRSIDAQAYRIIHFCAYNKFLSATWFSTMNAKRIFTDWLTWFGSSFCKYRGVVHSVFAQISFFTRFSRAIGQLHVQFVLWQRLLCALNQDVYRSFFCWSYQHKEMFLCLNGIL